MRLTRIHAPGPLTEGATLALAARASAHLARVLRLKAGAALALFDGAGGEHRATIRTIRDATVEVLVGAALVAAPDSPLAITLAQGVSRGERMDYAIQKATELGVARIVPLWCERSVVRLDAARAAKKHEHWCAVATAAAEQCGRARLPQLDAVTAFAAHVAAPATTALRLVLVPDASQGPRQLPAGVASIEVLVGPEGGLGPAEIELALARGYAGLRLGPRVLRTETAAAAAIAALQALYGDLG